MNMRNRRWCKLRLRPLEDRTAPAGVNSLLSRAEPTLLGDTANGSSYVQFDPTYSTAIPQNISADGRYVAFMSTAPNIVPGQVDTNDWYDVFLFDRVVNSTVLISGANGSPTNTANSKQIVPFSGSGSPVNSADGRYVSFTSTATNIVPGFESAPNAAQNIYIYDRITASSKLVSHRHDSLIKSASSFSEAAFVSMNGEFITFRSDAVDLVAGVPNPSGGTTTT